MPIENFFKTRPPRLTGADWEGDGWTRFIEEQRQGIIPIRWHHRALITTCTPSKRSIKCTAKIYQELNNYLRATSRLKLKSPAVARAVKSHRVAEVMQKVQCRFSTSTCCLARSQQFHLSVTDVV